MCAAGMSNRVAFETNVPCRSCGHPSRDHLREGPFGGVKHQICVGGKRRAGGRVGCGCYDLFDPADPEAA